MEKAQINNYFEKGREQNGSEANDVEEMLNLDLEWDEELEEKYRSAKNVAKSVFWNEVQSSSFDNVGLMHIIQNIMDDFRKQKDRALVLQKYRDGLGVTFEEMKFLCDTSELINACLDKNFMASATKLLEEKMINYMEIDLAERILMKHKEMKSLLSQIRNEYLLKKNIEQRKKFKSDDEKRAHEEKIKKEAEIVSRMKKSFITILEEKKPIMLKKGKNESPVSQSVIDLKMKSPLASAFANTYRTSRKQREILNNLTSAKFTEMLDSSNPKAKRHKYHPSSKLLRSSFKNSSTGEEKMLWELELEARYVDNPEERKQIMQDFSVKIKSPPNIKEPANFVKFYTTGPLITEPSALSIESVLKMQRLARGYLQRKRFKAMMQERKALAIRKIRPASAAPTFFQSGLSAEERVPKSEVFSKESHRKIAGDESKVLTREEKIIRRAAPKDLLLKQRKIMECAIKNNLYLAQNSGYIYYENDVRCKDKYGNTPLFYTALNKNKEFSLYLLGLGALVNDPCSNGNTALHAAFKANSLEIIMVLLDHGGDLNVLNSLNQTPIAFASEEIIKKLDLEKCVATVTDPKRASFNNNSIFIRKEITDFKHSTFIKLKYDRMETPNTNIVKEFPDSNKKTIVTFTPKPKEEEKKVEVPVEAKKDNNNNPKYQRLKSMGSSMRIKSASDKRVNQSSKNLLQSKKTTIY